MRIGNDERLFILKEHARKYFKLTKNVRILVLLISEIETEKYRYFATREIENNFELQKFIKQHPPNKAHHETLEILPTEACLINAKKNLQAKVLKELITFSKIKVRKLENYEYIIIVREEMLENLGKRKLSMLSKECDANFTELGFCILLSHEFLHIVEEVTGIQVYGSQERDDISQLRHLNTLPSEYWQKGTKNAVVSFTF